VTDNVIVHGYANDIFAVPTIIAYSNLLLFAGRYDGLLILTPLRVLSAAAVSSLVWEIGAIWIKPSATPDSLDVVAYFTGGWLYWRVARYTLGAEYARWKAEYG